MSTVKIEQQINQLIEELQHIRDLVEDECLGEAHEQLECQSGTIATIMSAFPDEEEDDHEGSDRQADIDAADVGL
jgi:hypothetical protein